MGIGDKAKDLGGKMKEGIGDATNNPDLQRSGAKDRAEAAVGEAKDKARARVDDVKDGSEGFGHKAAGAAEGVKDRLRDDDGR